MIFGFVEEMEREVTKLSRSRRSAAIFLQAALHYCRRMPHLCTSVSATSSDAASVVVMLKDRWKRYVKYVSPQ